MLKIVAAGTFLLVALAASASLLMAKPAPQQSAPASFAPAPAGTAFVPTCKAGEAVADTRPDPAWVGQSYAGDNCLAPAMPRPLNGLTASRPQVTAAMAAMKKYSAAAQEYQRCIGDFITAKQAVAQKAKLSLANSLILIEDHRITASQANQKKAAAQVTLAINQFNSYGSDCPD